jgi:hypothetical protein
MAKPNRPATTAGVDPMQEQSVTMIATSGCIKGRAMGLETETNNLRALWSVLFQHASWLGDESDEVVGPMFSLATLGNMCCNGLDGVTRELREIADDLDRQERAREKAESQSPEGRS